MITNPTSLTESAPKPESALKPKEFNLNTYKFHSLGDYADAIRRYGTTDSYSTQIVSKFIVELHDMGNLGISRVNYLIVIPRALTSGPARRNMKDSFPRLKGGSRGFIRYGRNFQQDKAMPCRMLRMLLAQVLSTSTLKSENLKTTPRIYRYLYNNMLAIQLFK
jgi:hypothetical protein